MKTKNTVNQKGLKSLMLFIIMIGVIVSASANPHRPKRYNFSNYYRGASVFMLGVTGGVSMRSFTVKSDIESIHDLKVIEEGWSVGVLLGGSNVRTQLIFGNYKNSSTISKEVGLRSYGGQVNAYPFQILGVHSKYFQPYIMTGIELSDIRFTGTYIPESEPPMTAQQLPCPCQCPDGSGAGLPPPNPDQVDGSSVGAPLPNPSTDTDLVEPVKQRVDKLLATQAIVGLGLECNFKVGNRFFGMFGEAQYGIPLGVEAFTQPLLNTSISRQMTLNFGIRIGLSN